MSAPRRKPRPHKGSTSELAKRQAKIKAGIRAERSRVAKGRRERELLRKLRGLKFRKSDVGRNVIVFLDPNLKRVSRERIQHGGQRVFAVKVGMRKGKRVARFIRTERKEIVARRFISYDFTPKQLQKLKVKLSPTKTSKSRILPTERELALGIGVQFERWVNALIRDIGSRGSKGNQHFLITLCIELPTGESKTFVGDFKKRFNQPFSPSMVRGLAYGTFWPQVADWLERFGFVAVGSASYIERRPYNKGLDRDEWKSMRDGKLYLWGKADLEETTFRQLVWNLERISDPRSR